MQFIKKNYEKILLALVLAGLVVVSVFLLFLVQNEKQRLEERRNSMLTLQPKALATPDLSQAEAWVKMASAPRALILSDNTHKLFNPERWQKPPNGPPVPNQVGWELQKLEVVRITNLYFTVTLELVNASESGVRYGIGIEDQAAAKANQRGRRTIYLSKGEKRDMGDRKVALQDVQGAADNPTEVILEFNDADKPISVSKEKQFRRVDGHLADLRYTLDNKLYLNRRANDPLTGKILVAGEEYSIVNITENEVTLQGKNQKRWPIKYNAAP